MIVVIGSTSICLLSCKDKWLHWLSFTLALCNQPFWFWTVIKHRQWGILLLACWYTIMFLRGAINHYPYKTN